MIPPEIQVACHNSSESSTLSGPSEVMKEFVASLTAKGIFAKEVPCSNIPFHSQYIADAGEITFDIIFSKKKPSWPSLCHMGNNFMCGTKTLIITFGCSSQSRTEPHSQDCTAAANRALRFTPK